MNRCAFLTTDNLDGFVPDDELAVGPLRELGWTVEFVPWRSPVPDWDSFHVVVIRTPWDYPDDRQAFLEVLETVDRSAARLENSIDLVRWNLDKRYLLDLAKSGVPVVSTQVLGEFDDDVADKLFHNFGTVEIVIKPVVGVNAEQTFRLDRQGLFEAQGMLRELSRNRTLMVQPFMTGVIEEGEYSLVYCGGTFSHAVLKQPQPDDFRTQEEYGAAINSVSPEPGLLESGQLVLDSLPQNPLYARVDLVRDVAGTFRVMELELIEPSLYLRMDTGAPARFAEAIDRQMRR